jgi:CheY-like chemotaxis protein
MLDATVSVSERKPIISTSAAVDGGYFDIPKELPSNDSQDTDTPSQYSGVKTPMPLSSQSTHPPRQPTQPSQTPQSTQHPQVPQPRFLLVEDNQINMRILQTYMKKLGHDYDSATDGLQALNWYKKRGGDYQCVLMDLSMPVLDGFESTRRMRAFEEEKRLPRCHILAISGLASKDAQEDAFSVGLDLFLSKPVQLKELSRVLESRGIF